jgi:geranylgeranyl diphosphate synthase, type I
MTSPLAEHSQAWLPQIEEDLQWVLGYPGPDRHPLYSRMLHYHMGWVDQDGNAFEHGAGKRVRPLLTLLVSHAASGDHSPARPPAAAVELIHNFSLLHDDIQDESPLRRNRPTVWSIWGRAQAINAGDVLFAQGHRAIPGLAKESERTAIAGQMLPVLDDMCLDLTRGQFLDMSFETSDSVTVDDYLDMIGGKTAALVGCAAQLGAMAASAPEESQRQFLEMGQNLGMAFQIIDDILDVWGKPEHTGKAEAIDIIQRKKSLPVVFALAHSQELRRRYQSPEPFDEPTVRRIVKTMAELGSRDFAHAKAEDYSTRTFDALRLAKPQADGGEALTELIEQLLRRDH